MAISLSGVFSFSLQPWCPFSLSLAEESSQMLKTCDVLFSCYWVFFSFWICLKHSYFGCFSSFQLISVIFSSSFRYQKWQFWFLAQIMKILHACNPFQLTFLFLLSVWNDSNIFTMPERFIRGDLVNNQLSACLLKVNILLA